MKCDGLSSARFDGKSFVRRTCQNGLRFPVSVLHDAERSVATPGRRTCVSNVRGDGQFTFPAGQIGHGVNIHAFHKCFWSDEKLHRSVNASIIRPVARLAARHHVLVEGIVHADGDGIALAPMQKSRDVERECGIAFARVVSCEFAIDPDCSGMEDRLKLHTHGVLRPAVSGSHLRQIESPPIPRDAAISRERSFYLPGMRDGDGSPTFTRGACPIPVVLHAPVVGIGAEEPFSA